jgi:hypothetical protein
VQAGVWCIGEYGDMLLQQTAVQENDVIELLTNVLVSTTSNPVCSVFHASLFSLLYSLFIISVAFVCATPYDSFHVEI